MFVGSDMQRVFLVGGLLILLSGVRVSGQEPAAVSGKAAQPASAITPLPSFDVSSVRENKSGEASYSNFPLNSGPQFGVQDGLLIARDTVFLQFLVFAYRPDMYQIQLFRARLPDWARSGHFDIQARTDSRPTKDEMRLMMQSLLAERFGMKIHHEMREREVYALVLVKPGKMGPMLKAHPEDDPSCSKVKIQAAVAGAYPGGCGMAASIAPKTAGNMAVAGYNMTMDAIAPALGGSGNIVDRPMVDKTGLTGKFDFTVEFTPDKNGGAGVDAGSPDLAGLTAVEAFREQLGLKLVVEKAMVDVVVIDHLEKPSAE
jgi:uncharacterized protein (TIGR03435 family)